MKFFVFFLASLGALMLGIMIYSELEHKWHDFYRKYKYNKNEAKRERLKKYLEANLTKKNAEKVDELVRIFLSREGWL